jgi:outer membrane protein assembly factor BamB
MTRMLLLCIVVATFACKPKDTASHETETIDSTQQMIPSSPPGLRMMWETEKTLTTAESVLYDKNNNILYVSAINGVPPDKRDSDGFIAQVSLDGKILNPKWAIGLSAPKGMGISDKTLYVTDIDKLVAIDLATGKIRESWKVNGAKFLNDVAIADDGTVYFTDSGTVSIYALRNDTVHTVYSDTALGGVNGVYVSGDQLMLSGYESGKVHRMDIGTHQIQLIADSIPNGDGIEPYGDGWIVSNWAGEVYHIGADGAVLELLDSQEAKLNAADIEVIADRNMLLIPTFFGNSVIAYELTKQ